MDEKIFRSINQHAGHYPFIDFVMIFVSKRIRFLFMFVLIFLWFKNKDSKKVATNSIISVVIVWFLLLLSKIFYYKPRPFMCHRVGILMPSKYNSTYFSKHTLLSFAASFSILFRKRLLGKIMLYFSILTGFSRIWVGHHYPLDIIRSIFVSGVVSLLVEKVNNLRMYFNRTEHTCKSLKIESPDRNQF